MYKEELLQVANAMSSDDAANTAYHVQEDEFHTLVLMTDTGIAIVEVMFDGEIVAITQEQVESLGEVESGFAITVKQNGIESVVTFDESCEISSVTDGLDISIDGTQFAGSMSELHELVEDDEIYVDIFSILDTMSIMLG